MFACLFLLFTCLRFLPADSIDGTLQNDDWLVEKSAEVAESSYERTTNSSLSESQEQIIDYEFTELKDEDVDDSAKVISHTDSPVDYTSDNSVKDAVTEPQSENITSKRTEELSSEATQPTSTSGYTSSYPEAEPISLFINKTQPTGNWKLNVLSSSFLNMTSILQKVFSQDWDDSDVPVLLQEISNEYVSLDDKLRNEGRRTLFSLELLTYELGCKAEWSKIWQKLDTYTSSSMTYFGRFRNIKDGQALVRYAESIINSTDPEVQAMVKSIKRNAHGSCRKREDDIGNITFPFPCVRGFLPEAKERDNSSYCHEAAFTALENLISNKSLSNTFCEVTTSPQQLLHELHHQLAVTDAKAYAVVQTSLAVLHLFRIGNFSTESKLTQNSYEEALKEQRQIFKETTVGISKWFGKCIPRFLDQTNTSIKFTELLQGYIINKVDLNSKQSCRGGCADYKATEEFGCHAKKFCNLRKCGTGKLYDCTFVEADSTVCVSSSKDRRYDWIKYKSGRLLGHNRTCQKELTTVNSWWRVTSHCSFCVCLCDKPGPRSDRYLSLKPVVSNIHSGKIVTGVRFIKKGRVVYIQIQEGKALPRGEVDKSTLAWKDVQPITLASLNDTTTNNTDYATLSWHQRTIDLDHLVAPKDHVVTGLRVRRLGGHLKLEIQVTSIDSTTSVMNPRSSIWLGNDNTPNSKLARKELLLPDADSPFFSPSGFLQESGHNEYLQFQASSLEKDLGQTTIPFLDAQAVSPEPPLWLSGIGLVHRGSPGNGGFLSLKVATYDLESHVAIQ